MAAALSAFHLRIPVMHVEAGLRTGGSNMSPFPEELNRQLVSTHRRDFTSLRPPPNLENLIREDIPVEADLRHREHGHRRLQWASKIDVRFANPELQELHEGGERIVDDHRPPTGELGRGAASGSRTGVARLAEAEPETHFVSFRCTPTQRVREALTRAAARGSTTSC